MTSITWDLSSLFSSKKSFKDGLSSAKQKLDKKPFASFVGKLKSPSSLKSFLQKYFQLSLQIEQLYTYAHLHQDTDLKDDEWKRHALTAFALFIQFNQQTAFWKSELMQLKKSAIDTLCRNKELFAYQFFLEKLFRYKAYTLSKKEEVLCAAMEKPLSHIPRTFAAMNNVDLHFEKVKDKKGKLHPLTHGLYLTYMQKSDRVLRKNSWVAMLTPFKQFENTLCELLSSHVAKHNFYAQARGFMGAMEAALYENHVDKAVYHRLIETTNAHLPLLHDYLDLKRKLLKYKKLHLYDVYASPIQQKKPITYQKATEMVIASCHPLGDSYQKCVKSALQKESWVDPYESKGKRSGAYSSGCYQSKPYILLNYCNTISDLFTLAHEMGHSMHSYLTWKTQPFYLSDYSIFLAEIASTFNEQLLFHYLYDRAKTPQEKIPLLYYNLEQMRTTFFRQTMFAEFELQIHQKGAIEPLTPQSINTIYSDLSQKFFGKAATLDPLAEIEWARIPHFYSNFYVYQYATGITAAHALVDKVLKGGFQKEYLAFLKSGSSTYPLDILRDLGVDFSKKAPFHFALDLFGKRVKELEGFANFL